eukprot:CAMPEP_0196579548 /NCGR_PEP_ID=MMETSP1081-20130531/22679_1 /TAXON_ID=36882 /ORGANISM="Pyramimonas amylifera, Strain CCMP720" /LENGTH=257 /DNA_ID=CAMNT_0041899171 /DNA_START=286 /DNA_END=1059 /DNA_ORIENTATION=+
MTTEDEPKRSVKPKDERKGAGLDHFMENVGVSMGPIALTMGDSADTRSFDEVSDAEKLSATEATGKGRMSTAEWRKQYEAEDGTVDLWVQEEFNAASRMPGSVPSSTTVNIENRAWHGDTWDEEVPVYNVKITDPVTGQVFEVQSPEDRYILFEAEEQGVSLPLACRHGCCTQCAVKIKSGSVSQPQALGVSQELKDQGYALLCVSYPNSDLEVELQDPDEVYELQFGDVFAKKALDKDGSGVLRDDFALELADMDE